MKKITAILITIVMISGVLWAKSLETKTLNIPAKSSGWIIVESVDWGIVSVSARANQGNVHIEVLNPRGKKIKSGVNKVRFKTKNKKGKYKIVFKNKTDKLQKVKVSISADGSPSEI